ncbi:MAG: hypothetical protein A3H57_01425 [Candidatus Taylorbacteria bacterium RIFCSPLOWO2_02_FULL_43_11]|uniref:Uncharacterized protein n=1 Tax=Candidatus Taylorbacteria bacterium RIFCSPHIGHO2_02_FULL_43_32b TaxID=1802306 RepID=A0A1G2ML12_9BACT|nr:MAG: hypothetical protein A3C72_01850 [Candidatus Taylorbacteria bacterium RIFCSPHIGHO2_02_FULL_43_32b]OHA35836.1 MAG: hypothetical protein A3H57_01425 [Candidatus Taylorbacteria bacterium RIFCSPLOWO2_02_FULL_43_11]
MKNDESFNERSTLNQVLKKVEFGLQETDPNKIDLRFLRLIYLADTYDGKGTPSDGHKYRAILYGNQIVYAWYKGYANGTGHDGYAAGSYLYDEMWVVSNIYLKIMEIAQRKFHRQELPKGDSSVGEEDLVFIPWKTLVVLRRHPQFRELKRFFGITLPWFPESSKCRVKVSKFYEKGQE